MTRDELEVAIKSANLWAGRSTLVLAIGILGEYVLLPFLERKRWQKGAKIAFAVLVVAGIVGEYEFSLKIAQYADQLQRISDQELTKATTQAGAAIERASKTDERSRGLEKDNLVLQAEVLKLREKLAGRRLTPDQQSTISGKLLRFRGMSAQIQLFNADNEIEEFAKDLAGALPPVFTAISLAQTPAGFSGVEVIVLEGATEQNLELARVLVSAFKAERIQVVGPMPQPRRTVLGGGGQTVTSPAPMIIIAIGRKP